MFIKIYARKKRKTPRIRQLTVSIVYTIGSWWWTVFVWAVVVSVVFYVIKGFTRLG